MARERLAVRRSMRTWTKVLILVLLGLLATGTPGSAEKTADWQPDGEGFVGVVDPAAAFFASLQFQKTIELPDRAFDMALNTAFTLEHDVPVGDGCALHVVETFTLKSWLRRPHRAVLFLAGPTSNADIWNIPVEGYNAGEMVASRGMFAFAVDYVGVGESCHPEDGSTIDIDTNVAALRELLKYIGFFRMVDKIDLVGEASGGSIAAELASDHKRVRSCVMSNMLYLQYDGLDQTLLTPAFAAYLSSFEDGYLFAPPSFYDHAVGANPFQEVLDFVYRTQPGFYPTGPFWILYELPYFDPGRARAPGLVVALRVNDGSGTFLKPSDAVELAADYGNHGAELVILDVPFPAAARLQDLEIAGAYWDAVFSFIDP